MMDPEHLTGRIPGWTKRREDAMTSNPILSLLAKKSFAKAYEAVRQDPTLINTPDEGGDTPFQWACRFGDKATMMTFLELGADLTLRDAEGALPLELVADGSPYATAAQVADRTAMAVALLEARCPLGDGALERACSLGAGKASDLVKLLIARAAKGDFVDAQGATLLHVACTYDLPEALDYGLRLGVDVNKATTASFDGGTTALHIAVKKRRTPMVEKLLAAGARADLVNKRKESPLSLAKGALRKVLEGPSNAAPAGPAAAAPARPAPARPAPAAPANNNVTAILSQLWKAPRDRALLGVYADWLIEQGETRRGEYIGLALLEQRTAAQTKRLQRLLATDRGRWLGEARRFVSAWVDSETTPGFVASATVSAQNMLAHFEEIAALGPELTLRLTPIKTRLLTKKLATLPLGKLYGLHLYNTPGTYRMNRDWLDDTSLGILAPAMVGLRALTLAPALQAQEGRGFTAASFESLAPVGASLVALTLDLSDSHPTRALLAALSPQTFPKLQALSFVGLDEAHQQRLRSIWAKAGPQLAFV